MCLVYTKTTLDFQHTLKEYKRTRLLFQRFRYNNCHLFCCHSVEWGNTHSLLVEVQTGAATIEISVLVPQKLKIDLLHDPTILLLGIYPKDSIAYSRDSRSFTFTAALLTIARKQKLPRCP